MIIKALKHTLIYALGPQLPRIVSLLLMPFITPHLTPNDYGIHGVIIAYLAAFSSLKDLGLSTILANSFYKTPWRYRLIWSRLFGFLNVWAIILALILFAILYLIIPGAAKEYFVLIGLLYCIPVAFFDTTILFGSRYFHLSQKPLSFILISVFGSLLTTVVIYYTIVHLKLGFLGWFIAVFAERVLTFTIYSYLLFFKKIISIRLNFSIKWLKPYLLVALPTLPHFYSGYILDSSDRLIMDLFHLDLNEIGLYNIGYGFGQYFSVINTAIGLSLGAIYLELFAKKSIIYEIKARNITWALQFGVLFGGLLLCLWMKEIFIILVKNDDLKTAYGITIFILMRYAGVIMYYAAVNKLIYLEKTKVLWRISLVAAMINIVLNIILIPYFGIIAAVITTMISGFYAGYVGFYLKDFKANNVVNYHAIPILALVLVSSIGIFFLKDTSKIYKGLITFLTCIGLVFFFYNQRKRLAEIIAE